MGKHAFSAYTNTKFTVHISKKQNETALNGGGVDQMRYMSEKGQHAVRNLPEI